MSMRAIWPQICCSLSCSVWSPRLKWMFNSSSRFTFNPGSTSTWWIGLKFMRSCTKQHVQRSLGVIKDINVLSKELYADLNSSPAFDFHLEERGCWWPFKYSRRKRRSWGDAGSTSFRLRCFFNWPSGSTSASTRSGDGYCRAYHYRCDAHSTPSTVLEQLKQQLERLGVELHKNTAVQSLKTQGAKVTAVVTDEGSFWRMRWWLLLAHGHSNYSKLQGFTCPFKRERIQFKWRKTYGISMPAILMEAKVAVTPMQGFTRFGHWNCGRQPQDRKNRVNAIAAAGAVYGGLKISDTTKAEVQCGLRPLSLTGCLFWGKPTNTLTLALLQDIPWWGGVLGRWRGN